MAEIEVAKSAGFCFGVQRAVNTVFNEIEKGGRSIYTYGPIIHNEHVVEQFSRQGVKVVESEEELMQLEEGSAVIIRSHGVGKYIYDLLTKKNIEIVDATCPYVKKIHRLVNEHSKAGERVLVIGNPMHPEVMGIVGWAEGPISTAETVEDIEKLDLKPSEKLFVVSQTTFNARKFQELVAILEKKRYYGTVINTICNATSERQSEARELAGRVDRMIVIGSKNSSNTKKLYEICKAVCEDTQLVQSVEDLSHMDDSTVRFVGITAGASTPKDIIEEVLTYARLKF